MNISEVLEFMLPDSVQIPTSQPATIYTAVPEVNETPAIVTKPPPTTVAEPEETSKPKPKIREAGNSGPKKPYVAYPDEIMAAISDNGESNNPHFRRKHGTGIPKLSASDENSNPAAKLFCREVYALPRGVLIPFPGTNDYPLYPEELTIGHIEKMKVEESVNQEIMEWMKKSVAVGLAPATSSGAGPSAPGDRVTMSHSAIWTSASKKVSSTRFLISQRSRNRVCFDIYLLAPLLRPLPVRAGARSQAKHRAAPPPPPPEERSPR